LDKAVIGNARKFAGTSKNKKLLMLYLSLIRSERDRLFAATARAAELTGVSQRTIERWIEGGAVQAIHVGRNFQVFLPSLEEYLTRRSDSYL
jgi:excisionase family DNA binding protein